MSSDRLALLDTALTWAVSSVPVSSAGLRLARSRLESGLNRTPPMNLTISPLTPERWPALEDLFGKSGASNGCWCMYWRIGPRYRSRSRADNKEDLARLAAAAAGAAGPAGGAPGAGGAAGPAGTAPGLLAF